MPSAVWVVSTDYGDGTTGLSFPSPGGSYKNIDFSGADKNAKYMKAFCDNGVKVWLQVEPADADVSKLIDLVLTQYTSYESCIIGFGIDVEWLER